MSFDVFLNFDGDCRDALNFYADVFKSEPSCIMTYGEAPPNPEYPVADADKGRVIYAYLPIFGHRVMFSDCPSGGDYYRKGTNIALSLGFDDKAEMERIFKALTDGGSVDMPLGKTFFSDYYGMLTDKFSITWQFSLYSNST